MYNATFNCYEPLDWSLNSGYATDIIYFDFKKAFDSVPHHRLLLKLKSYGISGNLLSWLNSFLTGRTAASYPQWCVLWVVQCCQWSPLGVGLGSDFVLNLCKWYSFSCGQSSATFCWWYQALSQNPVWKRHSPITRRYKQFIKLVQYLAPQFQHT